MKKKAAKSVLIIYKGVLGLFAFCCVWMLFYALSRKEAQGSWLYGQIGHLGWIFLLLVVTAILLGWIVLFFQKTSQMTEKGLHRWTVALFIAIAGVFAFMLANFRVIPFTDSFAMLDEGKFLQMNPGAVVDADNLYGNYFARYGNNYFLTICFKYLFILLSRLGIQDVYTPLYLMNVAALYLGVVFAYLAAKEAGGKKTALRVLFLLALNPVTYSLSFWIYSCSLSVPFMTAILWLGLKLYHARNCLKEVLYALACGAIAILSYFIRPTSMIPFIALAFLAVLLCVKNAKQLRKIVQAGLVSLVVIVMLFLACSNVGTAYFDQISENNYPITHWIMMSSHGTGGYDAADERYTGSFETKEEKMDANISKTLENYKEKGIWGTLDFWLQKMNTTFATGWSETNTRTINDSVFSPLYQLTAGDKMDISRIYFVAFRMTTFLLMLIGTIACLKKKEIDAYQFLFVLTVLGGIVFYMLWEAKSVYSVPFVPVMLLIAERGGSVVTTHREKILLLQQNLFWPKKRFVALVCALWVVVGITFLPVFLKDGVSHTDYTLRGDTIQVSGRVRELNTAGAYATQSFYAEKTFNRVDVFSSLDTKQSDGTAKYQIAILDENQTVLRQVEKTTDAVNNGRLIVEFSEITPSEKQMYYLQITRISAEGATLLPHYRPNLALDHYAGELQVNGSAQTVDLLLTVANCYEGPYMSSLFCLVLYLVGTVAAGFPLFFLLRQRQRRKNA